MKTDNAALKDLHKAFREFHETMEELHLLKRVAADLRSYRRMIRLKRYD